MRMTIYEMFLFCEIDGTDIADDVYDWVNYFGCCMDKSKSKDAYDKCMRYFATHIEVSNYRPKWYSNAFVSEFIHKNIDAFTKFMNENNITGFRPCEYDEIDDELFYDLYMNTFGSLINGNYSDSQYAELLKLLKGE